MIAAAESVMRGKNGWWWMREWAKRGKFGARTRKSFQKCGGAVSRRSGCPGGWEWGSSWLEGSQLDRRLVPTVASGLRKKVRPLAELPMRVVSLPYE